MRIITSLLGMSLLSILFVSSASGQVQRTFVSGLGNDNNPCSRTAPCRNFAQAISQTSAGGEVVVLDSAGYGPVSITQAVTLQAPSGVYAGISVFSGDGITINTGSTDTVILRGLSINNQGSTGNGISFNNFGTLHIENCIANGFISPGGNGLLFAPGAGFAALEVKDSIFRGNDTGIHLLGGAAAIEQVRLEFDHFAGLEVEGNALASIRNSLASHCVFGFVALSNSSSSAPDLEIESCSVFGNSSGVAAQSASTGVASVRISNSTVTHNVTGLSNLGSPAVLLSRGNNTVAANGFDTSGTIGPYSAM